MKFRAIQLYIILAVLVIFSSFFTFTNSNYAALGSNWLVFQVARTSNASIVGGLRPGDFTLGTVSDENLTVTFGTIFSCANILLKGSMEVFLDNKLVEKRSYGNFVSGQYGDAFGVNVKGLGIGKHRIDIKFVLNTYDIYGGTFADPIVIGDFREFTITKPSDPPKTCEELGNCPPKTCEELGNCPKFDYSLSNSGTSYVTKTNDNAFSQNTITKTLTAGVTQSVTLSLSGVPSGVIYSIASNACSPTCKSIITFVVAPYTKSGVYPITATGSPLNRQTSFDLVISGNLFTVSCNVAPKVAFINKTVTWTATVSGGTSPKTYSWSGTNIPTNPAPTTNPYSRSYGTIGQKTATVTVTDANNLQATCPIATVQINFNPSLEEF